MFPLATLTQAGLDEFGRLIVRTRDGLPVAEVRQECARIATDEGLSARLPGTVVVPRADAVVLATRQNVADHVIGLLNTAGIDWSPAADNRGLWSWLSLVYFEHLCRPSGTGARRRLRPTDPEKYILTHEYEGYYRHLVAFPAWVRRLHGERSRIFLCQQAYIMPDVVEQVASRYDLITSPAVVEVIDRLYWDPTTAQPKAGFTTTRRTDSGKQPAPGTLRALDLFLSQVACTYDLRSMTAEGIMGMLPQEFGRWCKKPLAKRRKQRNGRR